MLERQRRRKHSVAMTTFVACSLLLLAATVRAQSEHADHLVGDTFGKVHFETSCDAAVREDFDRAVAMLHSFFYPETERAFRAVIERDPSCAMAYWGVAISQRPNPLTAPFPPELLQRGWEAIQRARTTGMPTPRERAWIEALAPFFENAERVDQRTRTANYEAAMAALHGQYPDDTEAAAFYALALLEAVDLTDKTYTRQLRAAAILEGLRRDQSEHPGLAHYIIHAYDYAPIAAKGLPAAREYAALAPSAPHALHMPSHIFSTLGMWPEAIQSNLAADEANRRYAATTNPVMASTPARIAGRYHALDFLTNAYLQMGQDKNAKAIVEERNSTGASTAGGSITAHTGFAAIPVRYALERHAWAEAAALQPLATQFEQADAIIWFARALGAARLGDAAAAQESLVELSRIARKLAESGDPYWAEQVGIQEAAAGAWIALADGDEPRAVAQMTSAADREDLTEKHVAMENRLSPMRELLGELLLEANEPERALREFERSLATVPGRFRSIAGAATAAAQADKARIAAKHYRELLALAETGDGDRPVIQTAQAFLRRE
jgi:hypothetical protein